MRMSVQSLSDYMEEPELELCEETLPAIKDWDVGETYTVTLKVKMREKELCDDGSIEACFVILKASSEE